MEKFIDLLPATRSEPHRAITWEPCEADSGCACVGVLSIRRGKKETRYAVVEGYAAPGYGAGRAFQFIKSDGTRYNLFLADDKPHSTCDCSGCTYAASRRADARHGNQSDTLGCCHLDAMDSIVNFNRWLPDSRSNPGADVGNTEIDEARAEASAYEAMVEAAEAAGQPASHDDGDSDDEFPF